ncbi:myotubularin-related protein 10-B-like isoform X2 [Babylonia areolata]|uniref:myotubularin-related protein 10-B-like isoform X2 n=1 Tax=Babylonia areolata TaxID=304850 RepID=UPI003FD59CA2
MNGFGWADREIPRQLSTMSKRFMSYINNYEVEMKEKGKATFKSYISDCIDDEDEAERKEEEDEEVENSASAFFDNLMQPSLLPGERIITQAESALRFAPCSDRKQGISGNLFVTNFKVSFVTADKSSYSLKETKHQRNKLIDDNDIPLTCIDTVYQVLSGGRRKALVLGQTVSSTSKYLEIHCKDFRIHVFGFKFVPKDQNKRVTNTILHHCCPTRDDLLFAYEFALNGKFKDNRQRSQFYVQDDWDEELKRLKCEGRWRVTDVNKAFAMSTSLPEYFVVPSVLTNADVHKAADQYNEKRLPVWCYTYPRNGASLVRMSHLLPQSDFKSYEEKVLTAVKASSGDRGKVEVVDLSQTCPSLMDIRASGQRLMALCMTDSSKEFYSFDSTWLSRLDATQWLHHVAACLRMAADITERMQTKGQTIAVREETGCDVTCVVSCLVQILLDPFYRTVPGFASLVQREWVVMGHPFQRRSRLVQGTESEQSPVFLLFLDCVWQLLQQFPSRLAVTETFLTTLWDTQQLGLTDTFLFDSAWCRHRFYREGRRLAIVCLPSAWEWGLQFSEEDVMLFNNPLYTLTDTCDLEEVITSARGSLRRAGKLLPEAESYTRSLTEFHFDTAGRRDLFRRPESEVLLPIYTQVARLQLWSQCYLRWCVPAQILGGGRPAEYLQQCLLVEEVICLDHKLKVLEQQKSLQERVRDRFPRPNSGLVFSQESQSALDSGFLTSSFPFPAAVTAQTQHRLISGPLTLYLHDSLVQYEYADSDD